MDVKHKDGAAQLWCENASLLTGTAWEYVIVHQKEFEKLRPDEFSGAGVGGDGVSSDIMRSYSAIICRC